MASSQQLYFHHLKVENGLSQNSVLCFAEDKQGFIWIGTSSGLNRFDSKSFKVFKRDPSNSNSLIGNYIPSILNDSKNRLWVGTTGGLNMYNRDKGQFIRIFHREKDTQSLSNNLIRVLMEDRKGRIWVGTQNGLNLLNDPLNYRFKKISLPQPFTAPVLNDIKSIKEDSKGNIWIGVSNQVLKMTEHFGEWIIASFPLKASGRTSDEMTCTTIEEDEQQQLWVGTLGGGLLKYDPLKNSFLSIATAGMTSSKLPHDFIRKLRADGRGNLLIGTQEGLAVMDTKTGQIQIYQHQPENPYCLSQNSIYDLFFDNNKNLWVGTYYGGISLAYAKNTPFELIQASGKNTGLSNNIISAILGQKNKGIWMGSDGGGLNYWNPLTGNFEHYVHHVNDSTSLGANLVKCLFEDSKGELWIGTHGGGINRFDKNRKRFERFKHNRNGNSVSSNDIMRIKEDAEGYLWIATENNGLNQFDRKTGHFTLYHPDSTGYKKLPARFNRDLLVDQMKNIWLGSEEGLFIRKKGSESFVRYDYEFPDGSRIPAGEPVRSLFEDAQKQIWIGTDNQGIFIIQPRENQLLHFTTKEGLPSNYIKGMMQDLNDQVWITTDNGLCKFEKNGNVFLSFNVYDGLPGNDFTSNSFFRDQEGKIYVGGLNGVVAFHPEKIEKNNTENTIVFTGLRVGNQPVDPNTHPKVLTRELSQEHKVTLSHDQNVITIDFTLLNFIKSSKNTYAYLLSGFEKEWNYSKQGSATYTNLPAGHYTLLVRSANNDGRWNPATAKLEIEVTPPLWATWWAYLIYLIFAIAVISLLIRYFWMREKYKREKELQQYKLDFFTNISHEIRTQLSLITTPLSALDTEQSSFDGLKRQLKQIGRHATELTELVSELMDFRKAETGHMILHKEETDLVKLVSEIADSFQPAALGKKISMHLQYPSQPIRSRIDKKQFSKVIHNLISNALKFTNNGGEIGLVLEERSGKAHIKIWDNGLGIAPQHLKKIFTNYFQISPDESNTGYGIGLALSKSIIEQHQGSIEVVSKKANPKENGYTEFIVILPSITSKYNSAELPEQPPQTAARIPVEEDEKQKKWTLLLVEDNEDLRKMLIESLSQDYEVLWAENGQTGWELAQQHLPDLIISDIMMPLMDGLSLCKEIKSNQNTSHIPLVLLTAKATIQDQIEGLEFFADAYLTKPFDMKLLKTQINNLVQNRRRMQQIFREYYLQIAQPKKSDTTGDQFLDKLVAIIETNISNNQFNVAYLAKEMEMSQPVLYKKLKTLTGVSVNDFIKSIRLKQAATLLGSKQHAVHEVSLMVGFTDRKYFSREFKKQFGISPSAYADQPESNTSIDTYRSVDDAG